MSGSGSVCVFCGASTLLAPEYGQLAEDVGRLIARLGLRLVYGGGTAGMMGCVAEGALSEGGSVHGVIPALLSEREMAHAGLSRLVVTKTMFERKALLLEESDAFVVLPGGIGTLDEFFEILISNALGLSAKAVVVLDHDGFYAPVLHWLEGLHARGFCRAPAEMFSIARDLRDLESILGGSADPSPRVL